MSHSSHFDSAILKLYKAYYANELHPEDACRCAVGNILDGKDFWKHMSDDHGSLKLNYVGELHERLGRKFNGYAPSELMKIEAAFLEGCGYSLPLHYKGEKPENPTHPDTLFNGLSSVIDLLCHLEGISNIWELSVQFKSLHIIKRNQLNLATNE